MTEEQKARCRVIAAHYGVENQKYKACEEMAELIQVLMKTETEKIEFSHFENIIDEIADVCIMIEQLRFLFGEVDVDNRIVAKLNRQLERMERENDAPKDHTQGTWTKKRRSDEDIIDWKCSNCKTYVDLPSNRAPFRFCPNCGKEMKVIR
jgi:predicted RNA-binding Zn-ribbon protein involved in translation (DUF1610 family)